MGQVIRQSCTQDFFKSVSARKSTDSSLVMDAASAHSDALTRRQLPPPALLIDGDGKGTKTGPLLTPQGEQLLEAVQAPSLPAETTSQLSCIPRSPCSPTSFSRQPSCQSHAHRNPYLRVRFQGTQTPTTAPNYERSLHFVILF